MKILNACLAASLMLGAAGANELEEHKAGCGKWDKTLSQGGGDSRIRIIGADLQPFHGARACFEASYLRVGMLDAKEQAAVMEIAKRGGSPK